MVNGGVGCLVVPEGYVVKGVVTDRDLALGCLGNSHFCSDCNVSQHMSSPVIVCGPNMNVLEAARLMVDKNIKRLPVVEEGKLCGLLSFSDIATSMIPPMLHLMVGMGAARREKPTPAL